jgi:signal transduction histidine kinase
MAASLAPGAASPVATRGEKVNILLVDDQPARLLTYEAVLQGLQQNLVFARSGVEALEKLMHGEFAVVLLDVSMPGMDGFETARLIHEHPRFERTPIIFITGVHTSELDRLQGYKLGAVDYVSIPVVPEILRGKLAVLIELYSKRRELRDLNRELAKANQHLAEANAALQAEKARELQALNATLQLTNTELERANGALQSEVAERARAEDALRHADRQKDEFLAMLAHELRNPLAPIGNAVYLMKMKRLQDPQLRLSRDIIERQLAQLTRLVDDLLDVSRITRGGMILTRGNINLAEIVARAVETADPEIQARKHALKLEVSDPELQIYGDGVRLTQALGNLLSNAAKYTENGGSILLRAGRRGDHVEIAVRDSGIGIPGDALPRIFELFTQVDQRVGRVSSGLGIGLALVRRIVEMHGGGVTACSNGPGHGSEFVIRLPISVERRGGEPQEAGAATRVEVVPRTKRRVLVADDNADALDSLAELLTLNGHEVFRATDGVAALELAERCQPDVALLDIGMPRMDGYELARRIRAEPWGAQMQLVALTGWGQESDRKRSRDFGFDGHLTKPVDQHLLARLLSDAGALAATE